MAAISQNDKIELLYKKYLQLPSTGPGIPPNIEPLIDSTKRIYSQNYLFVQPIPQINLPLSNYLFEGTLGSNTSIFKNRDYPYIKYISTLSLSSVNIGNSIAYSSPHLSNVITNTYHISYIYKVWNSSKTKILYGIKDDNDPTPVENLMDYIILDQDTGVLRFYTYSSNVNYLNTPVISFYCYRGQIGSDSTFLRIQNM